MKILDCRNMACPQPVVEVKRALAELPAGETLQVLLDEGAPLENVSRFAGNRGYTVTPDNRDGAPALTIAAGGGPSAVAVLEQRGENVLLVTSDRLGDGPEDLGRLLMKNFLITQLDLPRVPDRILFLNTGVLLTTEGSEVLEALTKLAEMGAEIASCGICLDYFHRKEQLRVGAVTNMFSIAESLLQARLVIRP